MAIDYSNPAYGNFIDGSGPAPAGQSSPLQFSTTRGSNGALTTSTPGYAGAAPQGQGFGDVIAKILSNRQAARPQMAAQPMQLAPSAAAPQYQQAPQAYSPQFGAQQSGMSQRPEQLTRTVHDPRQSPYAKMATGLEPTAVVEKGYRNPKTGEIEWEYDSVRPHGSSGGIVGGGAASSLHPSDLSNEKAYRNGNPSNGYTDEYIDSTTGQVKKKAKT